MNVILLAGGLGKRLRPLTFAIPKPLIPIGEKPILELLLRKLKTSGIKKIYLAVGYRAELIQTYFGDGSRFGLELYYQAEKKPLGTAGPVRLIRDAYDLKGPFLVLNADIITKIDFRKLAQYHLKRNSAMTVVCSKYEYRLPYGVLKIKDTDVLGVEEKPALSFDISCGIYLLGPEAVSLIPAGRRFDMPELMLRLIKRNRQICVFKLKRGEWSAIETIEDLEGFYKRLKNKD